MKQVIFHFLATQTVQFSDNYKWTRKICLYQTTKELRIPTKNTSKNQIPIPEKTVPLFSAQPSGVAKTTGTPTTKRNDTTMNANKAN